jgi:uncharacterized lipoprotein YbaY
MSVAILVNAPFSTYVPLTHEGQSDSLFTAKIMQSAEERNPCCVVTGTVTYSEKMSLPRDAVLHVALLSNKLDGSVDNSLASVRIVTGGKQVPISFELPIEKSLLIGDHSYVLRAEILVRNKRWFYRDLPLPVSSLRSIHDLRIELRRTQ